MDFYPRPPRGGRLIPDGGFSPTKEISIHALREEGDANANCWGGRFQRFLSTPSARRATMLFLTVRRVYTRFLSTPSARRATRNSFYIGRLSPISIHALREEGDASKAAISQYLSGFLSTPSARRATAEAGMCLGPLRYFYPRPPRGGRQPPKFRMGVIKLFLSTPSARRATRQTIRRAAKRQNFYPRPPRGGRRRANL